MPRCLIALGSNLGARRQTLDRAVALLAAHPDIQLAATSRWHETRPVGGPGDQPPFLNGAVRLETSLAAETLLAVLQRIEDKLGRHRRERWAARTIDLDLLLYGEEVLATHALTVPHPRMAWRRFVLQPAVEVAADMIHPTTGWTIARLWKHLNGPVDYVALTGSIGVGKTHLAGRLAEKMNAHLISEPLDLPGLEAFYDNPAGKAWQTELEFLDQRSRLLADGPALRDLGGRLVVSDFWFDQSPAFARVWLSQDQLAAYDGHFRRARRGVILPKLTVLLEAPAEQLLARVRQRGRRCERHLRAEQLERIALAIREETTMADRGPVLRVTDGGTDAALHEVLAAVMAMRGG